MVCFVYVQLVRQGKCDEAIRRLEKWASEHPGHTGSVLQYAWTSDKRLAITKRRGVCMVYNKCHRRTSYVTRVACQEGE